MAKRTRGGFVPEDDPMFNGLWIVFVPRQMRHTKSGQPSEAEVEKPGSESPSNQVHGQPEEK